MGDIVEVPGGAACRVVLAGLDRLSSLAGAGRSVAVSDAALRKLYGPAFPPCPLIEVPRGEAAKDLRELERLYEAFDRLGLDRDSTVISIGGGSVSDLAGFAAATWLRGVGFCAAPTTLLAMVDAAIGGKNGVDFGGRKNLVGTFLQPRIVLCDTELLASLPDEQFASGMAEAVKHAVIEGGEHFGFVERECRDRACLGRERLQRLVRLSQSVKLGIVERDRRESGERRKLNLGHTIGHAIESASGLPHGHSVAAGIASAFRLAAELRPGAGADLERLTLLLDRWGLPSSIGAAYRLAAARGAAGAGSAPTGPSGSARASALADEGAFRSAVAAALASDKKRAGEELRFALPFAIGDVRVEPLPLALIARFAMEAP